MKGENKKFKREGSGRESLPTYLTRRIQALRSSSAEEILSIHSFIMVTGGLKNNNKSFEKLNGGPISSRSSSCCRIIHEEQTRLSFSQIDKDFYVVEKNEAP